MAFTIDGCYNSDDKDAEKRFEEFREKGMKFYLWLSSLEKPPTDDEYSNKMAEISEEG